MSRLLSRLFARWTGLDNWPLFRDAVSRHHAEPNPNPNPSRADAPPSQTPHHD